MRLTILGSGTCAPTIERSCASYYLNIGTQNMLLDVGFGAMRRMVEAGLDYRNVDTVLITHTHPDHCSDLVPLIMANTYTPGFQRRKPLTIYGPEGFQRFFESIGAQFGEWVARPPDFNVDVVEISGESFRIADCQIHAASMNHSRPTNGYRLEHRNAVFAFTGDTGPSEQAVELGRDADVFMVECSFPDEDAMETHMTPSRAADLATQSGCKTLLLTHFYPMMDDIDVNRIVRARFDGTIMLAKDLLTLDI